MANPNFPNNPGYNLYVGARYVPVFANPIEWDLSKTYEPLTIVTHQGNSYTSKTFVPANTQITNTTYWALTGNYNAQIEQYRQEVEAISEIANNNNKKLNNSFLYDFSNVIVYGDSFVGLDNPWQNYFATYMGIPSQNIHTYRNAGGGYINNGERGMPYLADFQSYVRPQINDPSDVSCVIIQGGLNDGITTSVTTEQQAAEAFIDYLKSTFPNAQIIGLTYLSLGMPVVSIIYGLNLAYKSRGCLNTPYAYTWIRGSEYDRGDGIHPNQAGNQHIGSMLANMLKGEGGLDERYSYIEISTPGITGNIVTRMTPFGVCITLNANTASTEQTIDIATLPKWAWPAGYIAMPCYLDGVGSAYITIDTNGAVKCYNKSALGAGGWGTIRYTGNIPFSFK